MPAAAQEAGVTVVEGFHYLFHPVMQRLFALLDSGELGELQRVEALVAMPEPDDGDPRWSFDLAGGALMDLGRYGLHAHRALGRWAGGEPELVDARAKERASARGRRVAGGRPALPVRATGAVRCSMTHPRFEMTLRVVGSRGEATVMDFVQPHKDDRVVVRTEDDETTEHLGTRSSYIYQLEEFIRRCAGDADADRPGRRRGHRAADRQLLPRVHFPCGTGRRSDHRTKELTTMTDPELEPLPEGTFEKLRQVSTSTIATQLYKRGFRQPQLLGEAAERGGRRVRRRGVHDAVHPDAGGRRRAGPLPQRQHPAVGGVRGPAARPGAGGRLYRTATAASGGDMLMTRAWKRGAAAVVTDGGLRDGPCWRRCRSRPTPRR